MYKHEMAIDAPRNTIIEANQKMDVSKNSFGDFGKDNPRSKMSTLCKLQLLFPTDIKENIREMNTTAEKRI